MCVLLCRWHPYKWFTGFGFLYVGYGDGCVAVEDVTELYQLLPLGLLHVAYICFYKGV